MEEPSGASCTAFAGVGRVARGALSDVAAAARAVLDREPAAQIQLFDDADGRAIDLDLRGTVAEVRDRYAPGEVTARGPGGRASASSVAR